MLLPEIVVAVYFVYFRPDALLALKPPLVLWMFSWIVANLLPMLAIMLIPQVMSTRWWLDGLHAIGWVLQLAGWLWLAFVVLAASKWTDEVSS